MDIAKVTAMIGTTRAVTLAVPGGWRTVEALVDRVTDRGVYFFIGGQVGVEYPWSSIVSIK